MIAWLASSFPPSPSPHGARALSTQQPGSRERVVAGLLLATLRKGWEKCHSVRAGCGKKAIVSHGQ